MSETVTPKSKAAPGWYADAARPGFERRWTGAGWVDEWRVPRSFWSQPVGYMFGGLLIQFVGGVVGGLFVIVAARSGSDSDVAGSVAGILGFATMGIAAFVGGILLLVGIIAKGVEVGNRASQ